MSDSLHIGNAKIDKKSNIIKKSCIFASPIVRVHFVPEIQPETLGKERGTTKCGQKQLVPLFFSFSEWFIERLVCVAKKGNRLIKINKDFCII